MANFDLQTLSWLLYVYLLTEQEQLSKLNADRLSGTTQADLKVMQFGFWDAITVTSATNVLYRRTLIVPFCRAYGSHQRVHAVVITHKIRSINLVIPTR